MTRNDIIRMAREAECSETFGSDAFMFTVEELERFAALVAAHVRETEFKPDWNNYRQGLADGAAAEREADQRAFWEACRPHGKAGEVIYTTYKHIRARNNQ